MFTCDSCEVIGCRKGEYEDAPKNCPIREEGVCAEAREEYEKENIKKFIDGTMQLENKGRGQLSRIEETIEFCKIMGYKKIGVAFCIGLKKEAKTFVKILKDNGFEVSSVICKNGSIDKNELILNDEDRKDRLEISCNPIGQAMLLNKEETEFNIALGLCVGHDSLFFKYVKAPATALVVKDRVLAHNPIGALYCAHSFYRKRFKK
ncbi:DUF1847 domain-containing protein [Crassaminicella thermophila]|uniref:DUF1847 domain-containing protein n=1 Tax=Crassaminicella thermophila TaxID=2599308 RepID=A0A5C0SGI9_CRATE|nr:DUF1847 domain-containing protein [Crassaminicella thermophila]QEK12514.1 DUF1847 domain-containing protein [Crassaminicella thermophila]